ncbi:MAG: translation initiation factor eIF-1A [Candidatus Diapherotrites archaeon]|nr:translation initiation factor eIF-1A [Candidatus Diapherotrites archaeon]
MVKKPRVVQQPGEFRLRLPNKADAEMFAVAIQLMGASQIKALCEDGKERMCRIKGTMKKKVWIRTGDVLIIRLWDYQNDRADIVWRYFGTQTQHLKQKGYLNNLPV